MFPLARCQFRQPLSVTVHFELFNRMTMDYNAAEILASLIANNSHTGPGKPDTSMIVDV